MLGQLKAGGLEVIYWDSTRQQYGPEKPYVTLEIKSPWVVLAMARNLTLGFGEAYMDGQIEVHGGLEQIQRLALANRNRFDFLGRFQIKDLKLNNSTSQPKLVQHHYDLGNDFYRLWLDESMTYSCAYFKKPSDTLEQAQKQKIAYLLKKLNLKNGQTVLEIGCGWGHLLVTAAKQYGISGLGITLSRQQHAFATKLAKSEGVSDKVQFKLMNFADLPASMQYDRVISVGMFEHVGRENIPSYFEAVNRVLRPGGISVLHTISGQTEAGRDAWIDKYIFPGGYLPSVREVVNKLPDYNFRLTDYENLRPHYALTLKHWWERYEANKGKVIKMYDERFYRMWRMYLACSMASFQYGGIDLSQFVFTKGVADDQPLTRESWYK